MRARRPFAADRPVFCKIGAFANLARGALILIKGQPHCLKRLKEPVEVLREELAAKDRIGPRARKFILGNGIAHYAMAL